MKESKNTVSENIRKNIIELYFQLEFLLFLKVEKMDEQEFLEYIRSRTKKLPSNIGKEWFGCFPIVDDRNILVEIRLMVPKIENMDNLLVNIHEYTHAFELYKELGTIYIEDRENREKRAINKENIYRKKKG